MLRGGPTMIVEKGCRIRSRECSKIFQVCAKNQKCIPQLQTDDRTLEYQVDSLRALRATPAVSQNRE